jgi:hypothetical protein
MANLSQNGSFRHGAVQNITFAAAGGASAPSSAFAAETYAIRVCLQGAITATSGARIVVGDGTPSATSTSELLPVNWIEYIICSPGQKIAVLSNDTVTGLLSVTELS